jgi:YegS/Rv2252/BmrU family lipid kinase
MSVALIINPLSGTGSLRAGQARVSCGSRALASIGEPSNVFVTERRGHARELAAAAVARGAHLVIAWGGDGTVNEVASALLGTDAALGMVPSGSGNGLARDLAVSWNAEQAIADAVSAPARRIDAGEIGGRPFVSVAGIGFDAHVAACFERSAGRRGLAGYVRIAARELWRYRAASYRLGDAGEGRRALLVTVANSSQFGNGARIAPAAKIDDGLLDMVVFEETSRIATIWGIPRLFTGTVARVRGVSTERIVRATVESDRPMIFHVDGEPVSGGNRLDIRVLPGALRVAVRGQPHQPRVANGGQVPD